MKVLFLGSDAFSFNVLLEVLSSKHSVCAVITQPPKPSGRGNKLTKTIIHQFAEQRGLPVFTFDRLKNNLDTVKKIDYDIALVASYGQILPDEFLQFRPCINVHPSLLPKYRGATPIQAALLNGDKVTGVTIMKVAKDVDAGDIILQEKYEIADEDNFEILQTDLARLGGTMAVKAIDMYENGGVKSTMQDHSKATFVSKITKEDGFLDFNLPSRQLVNKFRALGGNTGCYFSLNGQKIKVFELTEVDMSGRPCQILQNKKRLIIACKDRAIEIKRLQSPSGKTVDGASFCNGYKGDLSEVDKCLQI